MEGSRSRARLATIALAAVIMALTAFIVISAVLIGRFSAGHVWSAAGLFVIIVVTAVVGLVVVRHQPGNPIGWLLAGTAIFMLANIAAGSYAELVYDRGYRALSFGGLPALILSQLFNVSLTGFPLVILLFPDGRLPSRRWRPVLAVYLAIAAVTVLGTAVAVLQVAIGHHPVLEANGNLASLAQGRTAWAGLLEAVFLLSAAALWLAAVIRQALSWRRSDGERRQQLKWLASGAAVCGVLGFNRARYDADQTVAAFAARLKDAVDLDSVRTDLTGVVHRALEPAHVSLWLTPRD